MKEYKASSFDVFDTCISRTFEKPRDLFFTLGEKIAPKDFSDEKKIQFAYNFMHNRIKAEKIAKRKHGRRKSSTLQEIYDVLILPFGCEISKIEISSLEISLEYESSYCIKETLDIIKNKRCLGHKIIFISDMYHSEDFIKKLLKKHGIYEKEDSLYVSSRYVDTKKNGKLYQIVIENERILANEIIHTGDNYYSDVFMAKKQGLDAIHYVHSKIISHEIILDRRKFTPTECRANSISKYIRLTTRNFSEIESYIFSQIVPALISFSSWTLETAKKEKLDHLAFIARDGELPFLICKFLNRTGNIKPHLIFGSRRAWLAASYVANDFSWFKLVSSDELYSINEILLKSNFSNDVIYKFTEFLNKKNISTDKKFTKLECSNILADIINSPETGEIFVSHITDSKKTFIKYLENYFLVNSHNWAIVDSGWSLNCQRALSRIFYGTSKHKNIMGLYFGISDDHEPLSEIGKAHAFSNREFRFSKTRNFVESCLFPSRYHSTRAYRLANDNIQVDFSDYKISNFDKEYFRKLTIYSILFIRKLKQTNASLISNENFYINSQKLLYDLMTKPKYEVAKYLSSIQINRDSIHNNQNHSPLCQSINGKEIFNSVLLFLKGKKFGYYWFYGSIAMSSKKIKLIANTIIFLYGIKLKISNTVKFKK